MKKSVLNIFNMRALLTSTEHVPFPIMIEVQNVFLLTCDFLAAGHDVSLDCANRIWLVDL